MPAKPHVPTREQRDMVLAMVNCGVPHQAVADAVGIALRTLQKHYAEELERGGETFKAKVAGKLGWYAVTGPEGADQLRALIFIAKTRLGWTETSRHEVSGPDGGPVEIAAGLRDRLFDRLARLAAERDTGSDSPDQ